MVSIIYLKVKGAALTPNEILIYWCRSRCELIVSTSRDSGKTLTCKQTSVKSNFAKHLQSFSIGKMLSGTGSGF